MPLAALEGAELAYGHVPLLDRADFAIDAGERVVLVGRNGAGKSSLLAVLSGARALDAGSCWLRPGLKLAVVEQEPPLDPAATIVDTVAGGLAVQHDLLRRYHDLLARGADEPSALSGLPAIEARLAETGAWDVQRRVAALLERMQLDGALRVSACSGGMKKRVALARALVAEPELLLLDEPTNHLDIDGIAWLEELVRGFRGAVLLITHDRMFLDRVATRVVELDRGRLLSYPGSYAAYQERKARQLEVERVENARFDKFLKAEEAWIRKGVEARRTRNEGRVRRLEHLRRERAERRERQGAVRFGLDDRARSGRLVAEFVGVAKAFGGRPVVRGLDLSVMRGDKLGIIGPNGSGKSTLIRLLLGEIEPDAGLVRRGTRLEAAYFDQFRAVLDDAATLAETISPGSEWVETGGADGPVRRHVMTYLSDFLFPPERAQAKVGSLSGGERNRLLLARLFARPANLLILDEPTNDLDIDTLELLESLLQDFAGTVILVSHDRAFLDNVVTQVLVAEGDGQWTENPGGYSEWQAVLERRAALAQGARGQRAASVAPTGKAGAPAPASRRVKLSFKESRELEALPGRIAALEAEQAALNRRLADGAIYAEAPQEVGPAHARIEAIEAELMAALERWEALEARRG
ncbi:MAG: ATP-binding cassette domain-containing protein [Delftia acidovorans]|nr:ATP-binding cassette domain-containing protein [Delftia acidovorans]